MRKSDLPCAEILRLRRSKMTYRAIAEKYGTSRQFIEKICRSEERRERFEKGGDWMHDAVNDFDFMVNNTAPQ